LGFGAFAVDLTWIRMAQRQCQDVADAATQAAMIVLRATGNQDTAQIAATTVVAQNKIAGEYGELEQLDFGVWDEATRTFTPTATGPNAVRATVGRRNADGVPYMLARIWGYDKADVAGTSTSAARALQVILDMDITGSWSQPNFAKARTAAVNFLDTLTNSYGNDDMVGMVNFTNRYGIKFSKMKPVRDEATDHAYKIKWTNVLNVASKGGRHPTFPTECDSATKYLHTGAALNDWGAGPHAGQSPNETVAHSKGGCYPGMFREYSDEPGTDHTVGLEMARQMFAAEPNPSVYRALVMLTDGIPNALKADSGTLRGATVDPNYPAGSFFVGPVPRTVAQIQNESVTRAADMWSTMQVNQWDVSFVQDAAFMHSMPKGDGYFKLATDANALIPIFNDIAQSLPISVVE
jgi:hypothetical protein